ncbi:hypothetical protein [Persicobacter diffluens]|uniref:Uncharacterized protein n=1 Tax=Persicobacter diffluens TaxID=981 RepID=A0AAN5AJL3_9BACT|nr:hypothetical protein PEDI_17160 [Persicobacter diffluens]
MIKIYWALCILFFIGCKPKLKKVENVIINGYESKFFSSKAIKGLAYEYDNDSIAFISNDGTFSSYWKQYESNDTLIVEKHEYYRKNENYFLVSKAINNDIFRNVEYFTKDSVYLGGFEFHNLDLVKSDYKGEYLEGRRVILSYAINSTDSVTYNFEIINKMANNFGIEIFRDAEFKDYTDASLSDLLFQKFDYKNSIKLTWPKNYFKDDVFPLHMRIIEYNDANLVKADLIYKINLMIPEQDTLVLIHP